MAKRQTPFINDVDSVEISRGEDGFAIVRLHQGKGVYQCRVPESGITGWSPRPTVPGEMFTTWDLREGGKLRELIQATMNGERTIPVTFDGHPSFDPEARKW